MIRLFKAHRAAICKHAADEYPYECCGAILGTVHKQSRLTREIRPLTNVHEDGHERRFLISPHQMLDLERYSRESGLKILGFYHSHPDHPARPSEYDRAWAWPWLSYIIVSVQNGLPGDLTCWQLLDDRSAFTQEPVVEARRMQPKIRE